MDVSGTRLICILVASWVFHLLQLIFTSNNRFTSPAENLRVTVFCFFFGAFCRWNLASLLWCHWLRDCKFCQIIYLYLCIYLPCFHRSKYMNQLSSLNFSVMSSASAIIYQYLCVSPEYILLQQSLVKALFGLNLQMTRNAKERACCASSFHMNISYRQAQGGRNISVVLKRLNPEITKVYIHIVSIFQIPCLHLSSIFQSISCCGSISSRPSPPNSRFCPHFRQKSESPA